MIILRSQLLHRLAAASHGLTSTPKHSLYIHLKDHNNKINPEETRLKLSYMSPKTHTDITPQQAEFRSRLSVRIQKDLDKKIFEDYKFKLLEGQIHEEEIQEPDPLWGDSEKPSHFYKNLSKNQATWLSHSEFIDVKDLREELVHGYFKDVKSVGSIEECQDVNDLAALATNLRLAGDLDR